MSGMISPLPPAPATGDPDFDTKATAFLDALPAFVTYHRIDERHPRRIALPTRAACEYCKTAYLTAAPVVCRNCGAPAK